MANRGVTQIPFPGGSGATPTGAMQFEDDWLGLFIRGDDVIHLMFKIHHLFERLTNRDDVVLEGALAELAKYRDLVECDVIVRDPGDGRVSAD